MRFPSTLMLALVLVACGDAPVSTCTDADGDGYGNGTTCLGLDCDDTNAKVHPGAEDAIGDGMDSDCNNTERCYADADDDGFRTSDIAYSPNATCGDPGEATAEEPTGDCDDHDAKAYPGATELIATGKDESCDGHEVCYGDGDHDGARNATQVLSADADCADVGEGLATARVDCDDASTDDTPYTYYVDADHDGFGTAGDTVVVCTKPDGRASNTTDCDDTDGTAWTMANRYADADADGFGEGTAVAVCEGLEPPVGFAKVAGDCGSNDPTTYPGAPELPADGVDQDCVGGDLAVSDATGVFVRAGASDANAGTKASPVGTLARAHIVATGGKVIFIAGGTYPLDTVVTPFVRSLFGGYADDFASRGAQTTIDAVSMLSATEVTAAIERVSIRVDAVGDQSPGALFLVSSKITLRDVAIVRGNTDVARGVVGLDSTLIIDHAQISLEDAGDCDGVYANAGRLVLLRSRIRTCTGGSARITGVTVTNDTSGVAALAALFGNVIEVARTPAGPSYGVYLEDTRSNVLIAQSTIRLESSAAGGLMQGITVAPSTTDFTRVTAWNDIISASGGAGSVACVAAPGDAYSSVGIEGNDFFVTGAGHCAVSIANACVSSASIASCAFASCRVSSANLSVDPGYSDADAHIAGSSACVDAGVSLAQRAPSALYARDIDGDARPSGAGLDIGADERVP